MSDSATEKRSLTKVLNRISQVIAQSEDSAEYEKWKKNQIEALMWRAPELSWVGWTEACHFLQSFCEGKK